MRGTVSGADRRTDDERDARRRSDATSGCGRPPAPHHRRAGPPRRRRPAEDTPPRGVPGGFRATATRRGVRVRLELDEPATVDRAARPRGRRTLARRTVEVLGELVFRIIRRLRRGRYSVVLELEDAAGNVARRSLAARGADASGCRAWPAAALAPPTRRRRASRRAARRRARLTERGREQSSRPAPRWPLSGSTFQLVFTSPKVRAHETARLACEALGVGARLSHEPLRGASTPGRPGARGTRPATTTGSWSSGTTPTSPRSSTTSRARAPSSRRAAPPASALRGGQRRAASALLRPRELAALAG